MYLPQMTLPTNGKYYAIWGTSIYSQNFENVTGVDGWSSQNYPGGFSIGDETINNEEDNTTTVNKYVKFASGSNNGRTGYKLFDSNVTSALTTTYVVEFDLKFTVGNNQANSEFAIMDTGTYAANANVSDNYVLSIKSDTTGSQVFKINETEQIVTIPKDTESWLHI